MTRMRLATAAVLSAGVISTRAAAQHTLTVDSTGRAAASVGFGGVLPDTTVRELLRRYDVLPYGASLAGPGIFGRHEVPWEQVSLDIIAEARSKTASAGRENPHCFHIATLRALWRERRGVRVASGERDSFGRMRLADIELARSVRERVLRGDPVVYAVKVVGRIENLRRLAADPLVREFNLGRWATRGGRREPAAVGVNVPRELQRPATTPEIEALSDEEVRARLERIVNNPPAECRESLRNIEIEGDERVTRPQPVAGRSGTYTAAGLVFRAEAQLVAAYAHRPPAPNARMPQAVRTVVTVTNPSDRPIDVGIRGCTTQPRAYRAGDQTGRPVWDQSRGAQCMQERTRLALAPGESRTFAQNTDVWRILGESLPPGRYAFAVLFRLADETIEIPAGEIELPDRLAGLAYRATVRLADAALRASAGVTNTTSHSIYLEFGACALSLRAYRNPARSGTAVWHSDRRAPWSGHNLYACPAYLRTHTLAPRATFEPAEFQLHVPLIEVLGDSLPNGRYYFSATLQLNFGRTPEFPAGSALLALPRPPLPSSRMAEGVTYTAATSLVDSAGSPTIRTVVTLLLPLHPAAVRRGSKNAELHRYSRDCPLVLHAYRDRARRDDAPRSGAPDWTSARSCGAELQEMTLQGDEPRTFEVRATPREILGDRLPSGRYYLAVALRHENRTIYLAAGEADLTR